MGDARQQLPAALLIPAGPSNGFPQAAGHLVEGVADRGELILPGIGDAGVQIAAPQALGAGRQQVQGLLNMPEHEAGEEAVGQQHRAHHGQQDQEAGQRRHRAQVPPNMLPRRPEEIEDRAVLLFRKGRAVHPPLPGADEKRLAGQVLGGKQQSVVFRPRLASPRKGALYLRSGRDRDPRQSALENLKFLP